MRICSWLFFHTPGGKREGNKNGLTLPGLIQRADTSTSVSECSPWVSTPE